MDVGSHCSCIILPTEEDLLEKQINAYYVDNESGYEDAIDTLTDFGDQEEIDDESINQSKQTKGNHTESHIIDDINEDGGRETADTLADDMSMLSLDSSTDTSTRLRETFNLFYK